MRTAAHLGWLEALGVGISMLCGSNSSSGAGSYSSRGGCRGSNSSSDGGGSISGNASCSSGRVCGSSTSGGSGSSVAAVTAAAIDLLSVVAIDLAGYAEVALHRQAAAPNLKRNRTKGGALVRTPAPTLPLLTVHSIRQREEPQAAPGPVQELLTDPVTLGALSNELLVFYSSQLLQHYAVKQQQLTRGTPPNQGTATAAAVSAPCHTSASAGSWEQAEGLLLLGADRLQAATAGHSVHMAAVTAGWRSLLQQQMGALDYTEQQLRAAAAVFASACSSGSGSAANISRIGSTASSSGGDSRAACSNDSGIAASSSGKCPAASRRFNGSAASNSGSAATNSSSAGTNSSSAGSSSGSAAGRGKLVSVEQCCKHLAAAACCLTLTTSLVWDQVTFKPLLTTLLPGGHTAFACTNDPIECLVLCEALLPMPALLLFGASAALELTPSQQSLPLVAHLAWCAAMGMELSSKGQDLLYCCSNTSADLTPLMVEAYHHAKQPGSAPQTGEDTVQVQRNPWCAVSISGEQMTRVSLHMNCYITWCPDWPGATSVAGAVAQQLLQPGSTGASSGGQQQQQGTASCSGGNQQQQRGGAAACPDGHQQQQQQDQGAAACPNLQQQQQDAAACSGGNQQLQEASACSDGHQQQQQKQEEGSATCSGGQQQQQQQGAAGCSGGQQQHQQQQGAAAAWGVFGAALNSCRWLMSLSVQAGLQAYSARGCSPGAALLVCTAAAVQTSEAIVRLHAQAAASAVPTAGLGAAGAGFTEFQAVAAAAARAAAAAGGTATEAATTSLPAAVVAAVGEPYKKQLHYLKALLLPTAALGLLSRAPPSVRQSVAGLQLLQAAVSALLTVLKLQGVGAPGTGLLPGDLSFCLATAHHGLRSVTECVSQHDGQAGSGLKSEAASAAAMTSVGTDSSTSTLREAVNLVLQLLARCLHHLGCCMEAGSGMGTRNDFSFLTAEAACPMLSQGSLRGDHVVFGRPARNMAAYCVAAAAGRSLLAMARKTMGDSEAGTVQQCSNARMSAAADSSSSSRSATAAAAGGCGSSSSSSSTLGVGGSSSRNSSSSNAAAVSSALGAACSSSRATAAACSGSSSATTITSKDAAHSSSSSSKDQGIVSSGKSSRNTNNDAVTSAAVRDGWLLPQHGSYHSKSEEACGRQLLPPSVLPAAAAAVAAAAAGAGDSESAWEPYADSLKRLDGLVEKTQKACCTLMKDLQLTQQAQRQQQQKGCHDSKHKDASAQQLAQLLQDIVAEGAVYEACGELEESMQRIAGSICSQVPCRLCCANVSCTNLGSLSECFALVRGRTCVCGGCHAVRYCSPECQAAHWPAHKGVCRGMHSVRKAQAASQALNAVTMPAAEHTA